MKKKLTAFLLACMMCISGIWYGNVEVRAEELQGEAIDYSYLMGEGALIGYTQMQTRGVYLSSGSSSITKISESKIGAGGMTNAAVKCDVAITSIVERYVNGTWARVTSWSQTNENAYTAAISRSLIVATDNIYRVRSAHYAETDVSSSFTNNLQM